MRREYQNYSGWLEHSAFTAQLQKEGAGNMEVSGLGVYSFGMAVSSQVTPSGGGKITWEGVMVGALKTNDNIVHGDATIDIDNLSSPDIDVEFKNIRNLSSGEDVDDIMWDNLGTRKNLPLPKS